MVKSLLNSSLEYKESTTINTDDIGLENLQVYEIEYLETPFFIVLGSIDKSNEAEYNVSFVPIYILNPKTFAVSKRVGIYELNSKTELNNYVDQSNPDLLNLESMQNKIPIMFSFVKKDFLKKYSTKDVVVDDVDMISDDKDIVSQDRDVEIEADDYLKRPSDEKDDALFAMKDDINDSYKKWLLVYFNDMKFDIKTNGGGGDCFFLSIKDAYATKDITKTVENLREIVANKISQVEFDSYMETGDVYKERGRELETRLQELRTEIDAEKQIIKTLTDIQSKKEFLENLKPKQVEFSAIKHEKKMFENELNEIRKDPTKPLNMIFGLKTLGDLKQKIRSRGNSYWADENAIKILEEELLIKLIILEKLPEDRDRKADKMIENDVLLSCNVTNNLTSFNPEAYIMMEFSGYGHYQLITYKENGLFTFDELPTCVKNKIADLCLENKNSGFHNIPDFVKYKDDQVKINPPKEPDIPKGSKDSPISSQDSLNSCIDGLCDNSVVLTIDYNANPAKNPGFGLHEKIMKNMIKEFKPLQALSKKPHSKNWRKILSDEHEELNMNITVKGKQYKSIKDFMEYKAPESEKGTYQDALLSKFRDNDHLKLREILLATNNAMLQKHVNRNEPIFAKDLMLLRQKMR